MRLEVDWHDNGALIWTWPLALIVGAAGVALLGVAVFLRDGTVSIFGGILLFVAGSGRMCSALELRYAEVALAQPSGVVHHSGIRRRSLRRSSGVPWVTVALGVLVVAAVALSGDGPTTVDAETIVARGVFFGGGVGLILFGVMVGPVAGFVVTPQHLHIDTALHRVSVPRRLIGEFEHGDSDVRLRLRDGDHVDIRVDSPILEYTSRGYWMNARCRVRTVEKLVRMLQEVPPAECPDEGVIRRWRPVVMGGAGVVALASLGVGWVLLVA
ncbi:hypothetical protein [Actinoplanes sp. URMC 104]|uniref:hypothetical protein n=1 Tax=Actinoplanes sp. URMC 104 TaxID=3423409 RepID=UPI003F1BDDD4